MRKTIQISIVLALAASMASAGVVTKRFEWAPENGIQVLDWTENGITVKQLKFDLGSVVKPSRLSTARALVRVDNDSSVDVVPAVAIAIFDADNHLIGAGDAGVKIGDLNRGKREEFLVNFSHVFRNLDQAKYFYVTVETKR